MKRALFIVLVGAGGLALGWYSARHIRATVFNHRIMLVTIDPIFTPVLREHLEKLCQKTFNARNLRGWLAYMLHYQPLIARISCAKQDYGAVYITIVSKPLRFTINTTTVVDSNGQWYPISLIDNTYQQLPNIYVTNVVERRNQLFTTFARTAPNWLLQQYAIAWHSTYDVWLTDRTTQALVHVRADKLPNQRLLAIAQHLIGHATSKRQSAYADLRFADQIVIALKPRDQRGEGDVKGFSGTNHRIN